MDAWLESARDRVAAATEVASDQLELSDADVAVILELARVAAHESGDRTNAPLICYLVGLAVGRDPSAELSQLAVTASSGDANRR